MEGRKRAVGYVRVSSTAQAEHGLSIEHQRSKIINYCIQNNIELVELYEDAGKSGYNLKLLQRPGAVLLINAIKNEDIDYVIVTKNDRLGRDMEEKLFVRKLCQKNKVGIICIDQPSLSATEEESPTEKLISGIMDLLDEFYSMNLGLEVKKILTDKAYAGHYNGGKAPIGYKTVEIVNPQNNKKYKKFDIDEETAPIIRLIYSMYLQGNGISRITQYLNEINALNKNWTTGTVGDILKNPNYTGDKVWNRREAKRVKGRYKDRSEWIVAENAHPAIISKEDFNKVQELMKKRNKNSRKGNNRNEQHDSRVYGKYVLTGMIQCGKCGKTYVANSSSSTRSGTKNFYYVCPTNKDIPKGHERCSNSLNVKKLDYLVWQHLCEFLTPEQIVNEINKTLEVQNEENRLKNIKRKDIERQIEESKTKIDNLFNILATLNPQTQKTLIDRYNNEIMKLQEVVYDLEIRLHEMGESFEEELRFPIDNPIVLKDYLIHPDYINYLDAEVVKAIIQTLVERIIATRINDKETEIVIQFRINHPAISKIVNFRSRELPETDRVINMDEKIEDFPEELLKEKETEEENNEEKGVISRFTTFLRNLFVGFDCLVPPCRQAIVDDIGFGKTAAPPCPMGNPA